MASHSPSRRPRPVASIAPPHSAPTFAPYSPPPIPAGYYDPALDASRAAAGRGLLDTTQDVTLAGARAGEDYGLGAQALDTSWARGLGDIGTQRNNTLADFQTQSDAENNAYSRNVAMLTRNYGDLASQQAGQARKYGVSTGGTALLSAARRAENQAFDQSGLDTAHQQQMTGLATARDRTIAGLDLGQRQLGEDRNTQLGQLGVGYNRGVTDRSLALSRAGREDRFFGLDTEASKAYQAGQAGYIAPTPPPRRGPRKGVVRG